MVRGLMKAEGGGVRGMETFVFGVGRMSTSSEIGRLSGRRERVDGALWLAMRETDSVWKECSLSRDRGLRGPGENPGVVGVGGGRVGTQRCRSRRVSAVSAEEDWISSGLAASRVEGSVNVNTPWVSR